MTRVCVFAGAQNGNNQGYAHAAIELGQAIAEQGYSLVFGGGKVGLMGCVAQSALDAGAEVIGIIPRFLAHEEILLPGMSETLLVEDLFQRKAKMIGLSDMFIALPGGIGTLDELIEVMTWHQLRQLSNPIGILDTAEYFTPWVAALRHSVEQGFLDQRHVDAILRAQNATELLSLLMDVRKN